MSSFLKSHIFLPLHRNVALHFSYFFFSLILDNFPYTPGVQYIYSNLYAYCCLKIFFCIIYVSSVKTFYNYFLSRLISVINVHSERKYLHITCVTADYSIANSMLRPTIGCFLSIRKKLIKITMFFTCHRKLTLQIILTF